MWRWFISIIAESSVSQNHCVHIVFDFPMLPATPPFLFIFRCGRRSEFDVVDLLELIAKL